MRTLKIFVVAVVGIYALSSPSAYAFLQSNDANPVLSYTRSNTFDKYRVSNPKVIKDDSGYKMYFSGLGEQNKIQIGLAVSGDGVAWTRNDSQPNFRCGENQLSSCQSNLGWSSYRVGVVDALYKDGTYYLWYIGNSVNSGFSNFLGFATSLDGINWTSNATNPVFPEFNSEMIEFQSVLIINGVFHLYYRLNDDLGTYLATSYDGVNWLEQNNGQPINPNYILSIGTYRDQVYGFVDGYLYLSDDGIDFKKANLERVSESSIPQMEGTLIIGDEKAQLWNTKGVGFEFGGFFNTVINYYEGSSESIRNLFSDEDEIELSLSQLRADGKTEVGQGEIVVGNALVFQAEIENADSGKEYALQVEVERVEDNFDGENTFESALSDEATVSTKVRDFIKNQDLYGGNNRGDFKWRARVVDEDGNESAWVEYGNDGIDFTLRAVPLFTQQVSPYPSVEETSAWAGKPYAFERSPECGNKMRGCGCALSSLTTLARYHGILTGVDGSEVNPENLNTWLRNNNGYDSKDNLKFEEAIKYFGKKQGKTLLSNFKIKTYSESNPAAIRDFVAEHGPTVANATPLGYTHFFLLDSVLGRGYEISDPFWYNTDTTNEERDLDAKIQSYNDSVKSARLIAWNEEPQIVSRGLEIHLASPASLLITDAQGRRLGHDPRTGVTYSEIPTGEYWTEADISTEEAAGPVHEDTIAAIIDPSASPYRVEVIGEAAGEYFLSIYTSEEGGESRLREFVSSTTQGALHRYTASYADDQVYKDTELLGKFLAWLKAEIPNLPKGLQKPANHFIAKHEPVVAAGNVELLFLQRAILKRWDGRRVEARGLEFVPLIVSGGVN